MIIRRLQHMVGTEREVQAETWTSRRLLLEDDKMGFSMHDTVLRAGTETKMWYQNHLEAVYCIEGEATIEDLDSGEFHHLTPGTLYALDRHDRHILKIHKDFRVICVFNPPLLGPETHNKDGAYPLLERTPEGEVKEV